MKMDVSLRYGRIITMWPSRHIWLDLYKWISLFMNSFSLEIPIRISYIVVSWIHLWKLDFNLSYMSGTEGHFRNSYSLWSSLSFFFLLGSIPYGLILLLPLFLFSILRYFIELWNIQSLLGDGIFLWDQANQPSHEWNFLFYHQSGLALIWRFISVKYKDQNDSKLLEYSDLIDNKLLNIWIDLIV